MQSLGRSRARLAGGRARSGFAAALALLSLAAALAAGPQLLLAGCAAGPRPVAELAGERLAARRLEAGSLLSSRELGTVRASSLKAIFGLVSPALLSTQIGMRNLEARGYASWRVGRAKTLRDVREVAIRFVSRLPEGGAELQSGLLLIPEPRPGEAERLSWVVYMKGTELRRYETPTRGRGREISFIRIIASLGYAVWAPDYAGMGEAEGVQEYCVPASLAASGLDGLAAARDWLAGSPAYGESGRLAVMGYSEGGLGAMACLDALLKGSQEAPGLSLAAVYPMGAPLNLQIHAPLKDGNPFVFSHPEYQISLVLGWARAYPAELRAADILSPAAIADLLPLFDGRRTEDELASAISRATGARKGHVPDSAIYAPSFIRAMHGDPAVLPYHRVQLAERLDRVSPPEGLRVLLAAVPKDEVVSFENSASELAWAEATAPGSGLELLELASRDHLRGAVEALIYAVLDFDLRETSMRE